MNRCPRCQKLVYFAEEVIALGHHWHKSCFLCGNPECRKRLDSRNCADHAGDAYCSHCHRKLFGPKGYGYGLGAGTLSMENSADDVNGLAGSERRQHHFAQAQAAPLLELNNESGVGRASSLSMTSSSSANTGASSVNGGGSAHSPVSPPLPITTNSAYLKQLGGPDVCRRCGRVVYLAERMQGGGASWHKLSCFTCSMCNKRLESTTLCEKDGELFCKTCYGRNFGPKGYGFGIGAGTLQMQQ